MSVEQPPDGRDSEERDAERQERRRLINQTFRDGDLERCLKEIIAGLADEPEEPHLLKALAVVQNRFIDEITRPLVERGDITEAATSVVSLEAYGKLTPEASASLRSLKSRMESLRTSRPEPPTIPRTTAANASG